MRSLIWLWPSRNRVIRLSVGVSLPITLVRLTRSHQRAYRKSLFEASRAVCWPPSSQKYYWALSWNFPVEETWFPWSVSLNSTQMVQKFGVKVIYEHLNWPHNKWDKGCGPTWAIIGTWRLNVLTYTVATILIKIESGHSSFWFTNLWSFDQTDPTQDWGLSWDDTFTNRLDCNK